MTKITTFVPDGESSVGPSIYEGHLTREQIEKAARKLGGIDSDGYGGFEIAVLGEGEWLVSYAKDTEWETEPYGKEGVRVCWGDQGELSYVVRHSTAEPAPV